jgi:hypothetical protein
MSKRTRPTDKPADAPAATPPGAVTPPGSAVLGSGRLRVTQRDLDMYAALVGVPQTLLIPGEQPVQAQESGSATVRAWQSLTQYVARGLTVRFGRPDVSAWVRRMSGHARRRLRQAQLRLDRHNLSAPGGKPRA